MAMTMRTAKAVEYQITRQVISKRDRAEGSLAQQPEEHSWADRLILVLAVTVGLVVLGSYLGELVWVLLATATAYAIGYE